MEMESHTIEILDEYSPDITELNISKEEESEFGVVAIRLKLL